MKEKKIGVKFSLQQKTDFSIQMINDDTAKKDLKYPIYVQVTYNRKNTKFRLLNVEMTEKEFYSEATYDLLEDSRQRLERIVRLENELLKDEFELKGIGGRLSKYSDSVMVGLLDQLLNELGEKSRVLLEGEWPDLNIDGKGHFFINGLLGFVLSTAFTDSIERQKEIAESVVEIEQIGGSLLSRKAYNYYFTGDVSTYLKAFIGLYDKYNENDNLYNTDILVWLESIEKASVINTIQTIKELLFKYLKD